MFSHVCLSSFLIDYLVYESCLPLLRFGHSLTLTFNTLRLGSSYILLSFTTKFQLIPWQSVRIAYSLACIQDGRLYPQILTSQTLESPNCFRSAFARKPSNTSILSPSIIHSARAKFPLEECLSSSASTPPVALVLPPLPSAISSRCHPALPARRASFLLRCDGQQAHGGHQEACRVR